MWAEDLCWAEGLPAGHRGTSAGAAWRPAALMFGFYAGHWRQAARPFMEARPGRDAPPPHAPSRSGRRRADAQPFAAAAVHAAAVHACCGCCARWSLLLRQQVLQVRAHRFQPSGAAQLLVNHSVELLLRTHLILICGKAVKGAWVRARPAVGGEQVPGRSCVLCARLHTSKAPDRTAPHRTAPRRAHPAAWPRRGCPGRGRWAARAARARHPAQRTRRAAA